MFDFDDDILDRDETPDIDVDLDFNFDELQKECEDGTPKSDAIPDLFDRSKPLKELVRDEEEEESGFDISEEPNDTQESGFDLTQFGAEPTNESIEMIGGLESDGDFEYDGDFDETDTVKANEFDVSGTLESSEIDDYSILPETSAEFPYMVFEAKGNLRTVVSLCSGIMKRGDTQLYFRPEADDVGKLIPVISIAKSPANIRNLLRLAMKDSVKFRVSEDSPERLVTPEQFIRYIDLELAEEDNEYWNSLIEEEKQEQDSPQTTYDIEEIYG